MKVLENYAVPIDELADFLLDRVDEKLIIKKFTKEEVTIAIEKEYTEAEFHMGVLFNIAHHTDTTLEEKNACEYAINCIKTLDDMGVIKND